MATRSLYHIPASPYSTRVRLCLATKRLDVELRDAMVPALRAEAHGLSPLKKLPVLVDDGRVVADSTAISHFLDRAYPGPALWPTDVRAAHAAFALAPLVDGVLDVLTDFGTRWAPFALHPSFAAVQSDAMARVQCALSELAARADAAGTAPLTGAAWCAADIWLYTLVSWLEALGARRGTAPHVDRMLALGWALPEPLSRWAEGQRGRADVAM